jgi:hypothetical protein
MDLECCICLGSLFGESASQGGKLDVGVFRCGHLIHFTCGSQNLEHKAVCPYCRADFSKTPPHERLIFFAAPTRTSSMTLMGYIEKLSAECQEHKEKSSVLENRKHALRSQEIEMINTVDALRAEIDRSQRTISILEGRFQKELSARAEAEQLTALRDCAIETRRTLLETQDAHALTLRELNHITQKMNECRERMQSGLQHDRGIPYKKLRSERQ